MYELKDTEMIFVFTGPDGSGRKTIAEMVGTTLGMERVLSYTTRKPRAGEEEGEDYYYLSSEDFKKAEENHEFVESVLINGNYYGIKHSDIEKLFKKTGCIYVVLNPEGAKHLKVAFKDRVSRLFIYADREVIIKRMQDRGDSNELIELHMSHYDEAMEHMLECKYSYNNVDLAHTIFAITNTIEAYLDRNLLDLD